MLLREIVSHLELNLCAIASDFHQLCTNQPAERLRFKDLPS
jgi:hypothetical protein